jgi:DNA invertase Pin-like site-specific DNA recombinase
MTNALIVRSNTALARREKSLRAAQYVRMSTDYQRYSIENQAVVIAAYAQAHNLTIVRTYSDKGESGLTLRNREGLIELLDDVRSGHTEFGHILVFDVSRWGRFQDIDESAHYEFICKQAGIKVAYCAEQFDNDGSLISSIVKNLKRVMAAEYSRELSAKVFAGQCRLARMGFKLGGQVGYALRRELVDEKLQFMGVLKSGDRKYLVSDHVRLRPGEPDEVAVVRWIFQQFAQKRSETAIARELNRKAVVTSTGRPWNRALIGRILRNENYVGNLVFNRRSRKLRKAPVYNPPDLWIRSESCIEPIIERDAFVRAKKIIEERRVSLPEEEMLARLRRTLMKKGRLSPAIIDSTVGLPCTVSYQQHFGSLRNVYRLIGYTSKRNCEYIDSRAAWADLLAKLASQVAAEIEKMGGQAALSCPADCLRVNGATSITFRIARWCPGKQENHSSHWSIQRRVRLPTGWIVAIRLGEQNRAVLDYLLLPTTGIVGPLIRFSEKARARRGLERFGSFNALVRSLIRRVTTTRRASPTKSARLSRVPTPGRTKRTKGHGQRR